MSNKAKFWTAFAVGVVTSVTLVFLSSCGHHKKHKNTINVQDTPFTVAFIDSRTEVDREAIILGLKEELALWVAEHGAPEVNITVVVENDVDVEIEGDVDVNVINRRIKCKPKKKRCRIYHALCKWHKKKCKRHLCRKGPKPCDNED